MKDRLNPPPRAVSGALLAVLMLVALFLRLYELDHTPPGPFFDEAAATLLAGQVANGHSFPVFIPNYTGHEALYYYLTLPLIKLLGVTVLALRLTSALIGAASVFMAYALARELFADEPESEWLGLLSAALMAASFWHVSVSRYGYRAITLPLMQSLMLFALWRGQRRASYTWIITAGVLCGLTAYTYLSSRMVPAALAITFIAVVLDDRSLWKLRLKQWALLALVALMVVAPLGFFFSTHPGAFSERTAQVSIFDTANWQTTALENTRRVLQVFTVRGDPQIQFNLSEQPMFPGLWALAFYAGLAVIITRLIYPGGSSGWARYVLIITWPLVMLIPSILSDPQQIPHSLRSMGVMPFAFFIPALGVVAAMQLAVRSRWGQSQRTVTVLATLAFGIVLTANAAETCRSYFAGWAVQPSVYYENNGDVAGMARYLDSLPNDARPVYVHMLNWYHPTVQVLTRNYSQLKWIQGDGLFVFPAGPAVYAWPRNSLPDETWAGRFFPPQSRTAQNGPDGSPDFVISTVDRTPVIVPTHPLSGTFGGIVEAIGYDILRDRPSGGKTDVAVYWRVLRKPEQPDLSGLASLTDEWGSEWGQSDSAPYPSSQWTTGEVIAQRVRIQTEDGTPPGNRYTIKLGWWSPSTGQRLPKLDAEGRFAGTAVAAGPITVTRRARALDLNALNIEHRVSVDFGGLALLGHSDWPASLRQGESNSITLYWQARTVPLADRTITVQMLNDAGQSSVLSSSGPAHGTFPTSAWEANEFIADRMTLQIPRDTTPGNHTLRVQVDDWPAQSLFRFEVQGVTHQWTAPVASHPMSATLGSHIALAGYEIKSQTPASRAGASASTGKSQNVEVVLYWQALRTMEQDYTVFVHLVDANGAVKSQHDGMPMNGTYPTSRWLSGEFVADTHSIVLQPDLPPGDYTLKVGLYYAETGARLTTTGHQDAIVLDRIRVTR